jgi:hypothetical protein
MGFLWVDGYLHKSLNRMELSILTEDYNDILNLFDNSWSIYNRERKNRKPQTILGLYKKDICNLFRNEYNFTEKSFHSPNFLNKIDKNLLHCFIRGFFDGDGCFYVSKDKKCKQCYLAGSYDQDWTWIENILKELKINYNIKKKVQKDCKYSIVYIYKNSIGVFGKYIYNNYDNIGLKRKYKKYLEI